MGLFHAGLQKMSKEFVTAKNRVRRQRESILSADAVLSEGS